MEVANRPKLQKYIRKQRIEQTLVLLESVASLVVIEARGADFADPKDNYLLDLFDTISADFLITGDALLLDLNRHWNTSIVKYRDFCDLFNFE